MRTASWSSWMHAARPRTVLLSLSGVLTGGLLAAAQPPCYLAPILLSALTATLLQVLSNLANDYGDFVKGLDNPDRVGPQRVLQSGALTEAQLLKGILLIALLTLVSGGALLLTAWSHIGWKELVVFALLGIGAVAAAMRYTLGKHPYGYRGLGDLFCFLFFGWVAVAGTYYLSVASFDLLVLLPATAMGCCSNAVLNINNMRDHENDKAHGKNTLVVKLGLRKAFVYHVLLVVLPFLCLTAFLIAKHAVYYTYAFWMLFPLFLIDLFTIKRTLFTGVPDRLLPKQVLHTFLLTLAFGMLYLSF